MLGRPHLNAVGEVVTVKLIVRLFNGHYTSIWTPQAHTCLCDCCRVLHRWSCAFKCSHLTARPTATGEKHRTSVNNLARPRVGANVTPRDRSG